MADDNKTEIKDKKTKKTSSVIDKLVEEISKLSVLELSQLVSNLQEKLGVSPQVIASASPVQTAPQAEGTDASQASGDSGVTRNLIMTASGANKIAVIKALREINPNWGLKEAKDMTETLPAEIIKDGKPEDVKTGAEKLKAAGATVELK